MNDEKRTSSTDHGWAAFTDDGPPILDDARFQARFGFEEAGPPTTATDTSEQPQPQPPEPRASVAAPRPVRSSAPVVAPRPVSSPTVRPTVPETPMALREVVREAVSASGPEVQAAPPTVAYEQVGAEHVEDPATTVGRPEPRVPVPAAPEAPLLEHASPSATQSASPRHRATARGIPREALQAMLKQRDDDGAQAGTSSELTSESSSDDVGPEASETSGGRHLALVPVTTEVPAEAGASLGPVDEADRSNVPAVVAATQDEVAPPAEPAVVEETAAYSGLEASSMDGASGPTTVETEQDAGGTPSAPSGETPPVAARAVDGLQVPEPSLSETADPALGVSLDMDEDALADVLAVAAAVASERARLLTEVEQREEPAPEALVSARTFTEVVEAAFDEPSPPKKPLPPRRPTPSHGVPVVGGAAAGLGTVPGAEEGEPAVADTGPPSELLTEEVEWFKD